MSTLGPNLVRPEGQNFSSTKIKILPRVPLRSIKKQGEVSVGGLLCMLYDKKGSLNLVKVCPKGKIFEK